ncbi:transporter substrate-binding domain-containing diguanylate cyclase [Agathobaculum sp.]|uniref:transporter substrate-binding domain-containing diguanylate cyclase n=1 Tax=Agathobaculum sp. TaxID=2048138 RepID=UPI002A81DC8B|nr:transporter substrate-binding domain-containing protein [Agathobaculum sp.]MDY3619228.1 transporter substrate-binding domain-containing protein [Agathobaculum sp.]
MWNACNSWRGALARLVLAVLLLPVLLSAGSAAGGGGSRTIRVAYPIQAGLTDIDENGNYSGYTYEYLEEIAQYTGWDYEFVQVPGSADESLLTLMEMLDNGDVDLMGGMLFTEETGERYDYTAHSYGTVQTVLQVAYDDPGSFVVDSQQEQSLRVAVGGKATQRRKELEEFCKVNLIDVTYVECSGTEEQLLALEDGRADAILNTSLNYIGGVRTIAEFSPKPFYFVASKKARAGLMQELNEAMLNIQRIDPFFTAKLQEKYFSSPNDVLLLTEQEKQYIASREAVRVGVLTGQPPLQYTDAESGELRGMMIDLLGYIAEQTGLKFEMTAVKTPDEMYALVQSGQVDMIGGTTYDYELAGSKGIAMTRPFVSAQYVLVMHERDDADAVMGQALALTTNATYGTDYPGEIVRYATTGECIKAVAEGKAAFTYADGYAAQYYASLPEYSMLRLIPQTSTLREICMGVAAPADQMLLGILNKSILALPDEQKQAMVYSNVSMKQDFSIWQFMQNHALETILIVCLISGVIIALLAANLRMRARRNKQTAFELKKRLQVYGLLNEYFFEFDFPKKKLLVSLPAQNGDKARVLEYDEHWVAGDEELQQARLEFRKLIYEGDGVYEIYTCCSPDKKMHWLRLAIEKVYDDAGNPAYAVGKIAVIDDEVAERERLRRQAQRDSLTGVYNASTSRALVEQGLSALKEGQTGALLLIDVDRFKTVNDTYGHMEGDRVLVGVAEILLKNFRERDVVGRPGGDEFLVYMVQVSGREALEKRCVKLCEAARALGREYGRQLTITVGAILTQQGQTYDEVYRKADAALYDAKSAGRDRYEIAK